MVSDTLKNAPQILAPIAVVYDQRVKKYGAQARGVYWADKKTQFQRFEIFLDLLGEDALKGDFTINDLGCGYGALHKFLAGLNMEKPFRYLGYDISEEMVAKARQRIKDPNAHFEQSLIAFHPADYSVASGTFSLIIDTPVAEWEEYIKASLVDLWRHSGKGIAFNILAHGSKPKSSGLYTAKSGPYVQFCREQLSPNVELLDDYDLSEWTIIVRR